MLSWFFDSWSKSRSFTEIELEVLRLFLPIGNEYADRLYSQATNAPFVERKLVGPCGYEAIIPYVVDDSMLIECDEDIKSPVVVLAAQTDETLTFSVEICRGGFLRGLKGQSSGGTPWPKKWSVDLQKVRSPHDIGEWISQPLSKKVRDRLIRQLAQWCGLSGECGGEVPHLATVRVATPATDVLIQSCEGRLQVRLSKQYCQLLAITNGFGINRGRPYDVLGTADIYVLDEGQEWLCLTPLGEDGCVAIQCKDRVASNECYLLSGDGHAKHLGDIKQYARELLLGVDPSRGLPR
ncbi:MAG: hypothetical protein ACO1RA_08765 [Planctomycetaceae bacterium]